MFHFDKDIAFSDNVLYAAQCAETRTEEENQEYVFTKYTYPSVCIPNRNRALSLSLKSEESSEIVELKKSIKEYNSYVEELEKIEGFRKYFVEHGFCVSKEEVSKTWSEEVSEKVFSKNNCVFSPDLVIKNGYLYDKYHGHLYSVLIDDTDVQIPIGKSAMDYPSSVGNKTIIWNWIDSGNDFTFAIWNLLGVGEKKEGTEDDEDAVCYPFEFYSQWRFDTVYPQLVRIFQKMESLGYIHTYTVFPGTTDVRWMQYGKGNGSIDLAIVDNSFKKNKLLMRQIEAILWTKEKELAEKPYVLTGSNGEQYLSEKPGAFGGHVKLKIYGRLDCPSAIGYINKGQYVKNRVFFIDEETAIKAGFRPCAICMPEAYSKWKETKKE